MKQREVTIFISTQDIQNMLNCTEEEANRIWDGLDEEIDIEESFTQEVMDSLVCTVHNWKRANQ